MSKGSSNYNKRHHTSKPYDVSQSFVAKVASRVSGYLPQRSWLNRWLPAGDTTGGRPQDETDLNQVNIHSSTRLDHGPGPSKRPRLPLDSPFVHNRFLQNAAGQVEEEISPIVHADVHEEPAPVAGPSGLCRNSYTPLSTNANDPQPPPLKQIKLGDKLGAVTPQRGSDEKLNGDDCSETSESTSGCSSLVPQAQNSQNRRSESRHLNFSGSSSRVGASLLDRSALFSGRGSPKVGLTSLQRRQPSFDPVAFTTGRLGNESGRDSRLGSSPFYRGRTMYGGASAYHSSTGSCLFYADRTTPRRSSVTVRPLNADSSAEPALSTTAKKILDALEQFSTPVAEAKKFPITPGTKRKLERYTELSLPTTSELLRVKRRERLQTSTSAARQASFSSTQSGSKETSTKPAPEYRLRSEANEGHSPTLKMRLRTCEDYDEEEEVNLPDVALRVATLPKIDIPIPPRPKPLASTTTTGGLASNLSGSGASKSVKPPAAAETPATQRSPTAASAGALSEEFKMSAPMSVKSAVISRTSSSSVEQFNFVFSKPFVHSNGKRDDAVFSLNSNKNNNSSDKKLDLTESVSPKSADTSKLGSNFKFNASVSPQKDVKTVAVISATASTHLKSDTTKSSDNFWKCATCMVKNSNDTVVCKACDFKKLSSSATTPMTSSLLTFKPPADTWECKECFIRNKNSLTVCAACASPKATAAITSSSPFTVSSASSSTTSTVIPTTSSKLISSTVPPASDALSGFGDKFKPPSDTWECKECFVRNKNGTDSCISCSSPKPGAAKAAVASDKPASSSTGFGNLFKKPEGAWECTSCMVQNDSKAVKCVACETSKPGAEKSVSSTSSTGLISASGFTFGVNAATSNEEPKFTFGCNNNNNSNTTNNNKKEGFGSGFQFGSSSKAPAFNTSANFTFGIPKATTPNDADSSPKEKDKKTPDAKLTNPLRELAKLQEKQFGNAQSTLKSSAVNHNESHESSNEKSSSSTSKAPLISGSVLGNAKSNDGPKKVDDGQINSNKIESNTSNLFTFGSVAASSEKTDNSSKGVGSLVSKTADQSSTPTNLLLGNAVSKPQVDTKPATAQSSNLFVFGTKSNSAGLNTPFNADSTKTSSLFVFGSAASDPSAGKAVSGFSSGVDNQTQPSSVSDTSNTSFTVNKDTMNIFRNVTSDAKPIFGGGSSTNLANDTKAASNPLTNSTTPVFGAPASSAVNSSGLLQGGAFKQDTSSSTAPSFMAFGPAANSNTQSPFQSQTNSQQDKPSLFSIGNANNGLQQQALTTTQSSGFTFGSAPTQPASGSSSDQTKPNVFGFSGQSQSPAFSFTPSAPTQNFNFTSKEVDSAQPFSFSSATSKQSAPAPTFGLQNTTPSFATNSAPANLFSFGSQSTQQSTTVPQVFSFNNTQASAAPPTATSNPFLFGSSADSNSQTLPSFDPNTRPTFNFTGGSTPSFTASPSPTPNVVRRVIKKAHRRNPVR